jgi:peptidyl-prolyl cis-trans isomerase D
MMIRRLNELTRLAVWLPDREIARRLREGETKLTIRYALEGLDEAEKSVAVTDDEIKKYYDAHRTEFMKPATVRVRCLTLPWKAPSEEPAVTDEEVKAHYEGHPGEFSHGKRVRARQILFTAEGKDREAAERQAEEAAAVRAKLRDGGNFAKLAGKYSKDKKSASKGGDLGFIEAGEMSKEFTDAAFSLAAGQVSEPVKTAAGYHLIAVDEVQEPGTKPLEEVKESLRARLRREKKERAADEEKENAYRRAVDVSLALVDKPDIDEVARARSLDVKDIGPFAEGEIVKEIGPSRDFSKASFETEIGSFSDIIELPGKGYCIVVPKEKTEAGTLPIEEAREKIVAALKAKKAAALAHETAAGRRAEIVKIMKDRKLDFAAACADIPVKTQETAPFTPRSPIPGLGFEPALASVAAAMKPGEPSGVFDLKKGSCFFAVTSRMEPTEKEIAEGMERFRARALREEEGRVLGEWNRWLHEQAKKIDYLPERAARKEAPDAGG